MLHPSPAVLSDRRQLQLVHSDPSQVVNLISVSPTHEYRLDLQLNRKFPPETQYLRHNNLDQFASWISTKIES
jgi:hypothetical protein